MAANISGSNITNSSWNEDLYNHISFLIRVYNGNQQFTAVVGSLLNAWFVVAILSSRQVASRVRNMIICNSFVLHLLNCTIILPITIHVTYAEIRKSCIFWTIIDNLNLMHDLIANWLLVMMIAVFIAQIESFNPVTRLSPRAAIFGKVVLLAFPWIASLVIVPVIIHEYGKYRVNKYWQCVSSNYDSLEVFRSIDTALPIILAILLVIIAAVVRRRRFALGMSSGSIQAELFEPGPEIDNILPYVVAVIVSTLCDLIRLLKALNRYPLGKDVWTRWNILLATEILSESRALLMPITWLLFPDIRQRIKTWRPWRTSCTDLTVTFQKGT